MSDNPEPLSAILAEMRDERIIRLDGADVTRCLLSNLADRIEVAAKRDEDRRRDEVLSLQRTIVKMQDAIARQADAVNAAALRSALESIEDDCRVLDRKDMWEEEGECYYDALRDIREKVSAALATPARNCDQFATAEEAVAAFADHLSAWENAHGICSEYPDHPVKVPAGAFAWLFAPAEGGDHA